MAIFVLLYRQQIALVSILSSVVRSPRAISNVFQVSRKKKLGDGFSSDAQRALNITRSAPGIACALVGMKQTAHIKENLRLCSFPLLEPDIFEVLMKNG